MAEARTQHNCRVIHFGNKWWTTTMQLDIESLRMCYPQDDVHPPKKRWFHILEWLLGAPRKLYLDSGVQQTVMRKFVTDKIRNTMKERYGDWLYDHPFDFSELVFVFDSVTEGKSKSVCFSERVMA